MRKLTKVLGLLTILAALAAFPVGCLAQAAGVDATTAGTFTPASIVAILVSVAGLIAGIQQWLPEGTHTVVNGVILFLGGAAAALKELPPGASLTMIAFALVGVIVSRFRTKGGWKL